MSVYETPAAQKKNCATANPHTVSKVRTQKKAPRDLSRFSIESEFSPSDALSYPLEKKQNNKRRQQDERRSPPFELLLITVDRSADPEIFRCQPRPARQDRALGAVRAASCGARASGTLPELCVGHFFSVGEALDFQKPAANFPLRIRVRLYQRKNFDAT